MPKMKTKKSAAKRFKIRASGSIKRGQAFKRHILTKIRKLTEFLEEGDKAKVTMRFRGREMAHQELGLKVLERVKADLEVLSQVEAMPRLEGRQMVMVLSPRKKK